MRDTANERNGAGGSICAFAVWQNVQVEKGSWRIEGKTIRIENATDVKILINCTTNYDLKNLPSIATTDTKIIASMELMQVEKDFDNVLSDHIRQHRMQMDRVKFTLGGD